MSTKLASIPSARRATYPASSLLAWETAESTVDQKMASHPRGLLKATTLAWASSMPSRSRSSRSATRSLRRPIASADPVDQVPHQPGSEDHEPHEDADPERRW